MVRPGDTDGENEWDRALYVGMTRASDGLALVCPQNVRGKFRHPSRVLIDAGIARPNPNVE
jgi:superfamily I DNA/RNA helicase